MQVLAYSIIISDTHTFTPASPLSNRVRNSAGFLAISGLPLYDTQSPYRNVRFLCVTQGRTQTSLSVKGVAYKFRSRSDNNNFIFGLCGNIFSAFAIVFNEWSQRFTPGVLSLLLD